MARNKTAQPVADETTSDVIEAEAPVTETAATEVPEVDLTAFEAAVNEALEGADADTGDLANQYFEGVSKAYQAIEGIKGKNAAKRLLEDGMGVALDKDDLAAAKVYMRLKDKATVATRAPAEKKVATPADLAQAFADKITTLRVALEFASTQVPEGADGWADKVGDVATITQSAVDFDEWLHADEEARGDEPEVSAIVRSAVKIAQGKVSRAKGGPRISNGLRRDVAAHILNAFEGVESGQFLTVSEIVNTRSEEYGDDKPSAGAVSVRLFPSSGKACTIAGVVPSSNEKGTRGARKA